MKRTFLLPLTTLLLLFCTACASQDSAPAPNYDIAPAGQWSDGTYQASSAAYGGDLAVSVTIQSGRLASIDADAPNETPDRGGAAIEQMIPAMLDAQSVEVDGVSGATETADALRDAVAQCLEAASQGSDDLSDE